MVLELILTALNGLQQLHYQDSTTKEPQFVKNEYLVSGSFVSINIGFSLNISNSSFVQVQRSTNKDYRVFIILVAILRIIK
jgi:hypothetical protein